MNSLPEKPWTLTVQQTAAELGTDLRSGLTQGEASDRLTRFGANELETEDAIPAWRRFLQQFKDALVILLIAAAVVSLAAWTIERESDLPYESIAILAIVLMNAILGYLQEDRAEKALTALRKMTLPEATVCREGRQVRLASSQLVPGDLLELGEGDTIPADARIVSMAELQTLESSLTGESTPVRKSLDPVEADAGVGDRANMTFSGTAVSHGHGRAIVTATGMSTELGRIAGLLKRTTTELTPLQQQLDRTGKQLGIGALILAIIVVSSLLLHYGASSNQILLESLLFGVALAVSAAPEGLAAVVTVVLSLGVQRMARRGAIVRKLPAVETLGSASIIASDKTGTLTRNEMTVRAVVTASGSFAISGTGYAPEGEVSRQEGGELDEAQRADCEMLLRAAALANNASHLEKEGKWTMQGDPTEGALLVAAAKAGMESSALQERFRRLAETPFSSERKLMSAIHANPDNSAEAFLFVKGAADVLLDRCQDEWRHGAAQTLTEDRRNQIRGQNEDLAAKALRTLGIAFRPVPANHPPGEESERDLIFLGLVGMIDPPREEAREAVARAHTAGVRTLMITGDHPITALAIAKELGITSDHEALTGKQLQELSSEDLAGKAARVSVYARVSPEHKLRIVEALRRNGDTVAMTGDGVNDAPALKAADIGIAMGITGTDVAKEAADLVLTDDNFATIVAAVEEGRGIFDNIRKFLIYLLSSNAGEVLAVFGGVMLEGPLGLGDHGEFVLPLLATQILWINLVTDGTPALALGLDPGEASLMNRPPRPPGENVITPRMLWRIGLVSVVMGAGTILVFDASLPGGLFAGSGDLAFGRTMAFTTLTFFQLFNAFNSRSLERSAFSSPFSNLWLWGAVALSALLHVFVIYVPALQSAFGTVPLRPSDWLLCLAVASSVLWIVEAVKLLMRLRGAIR